MLKREEITRERVDRLVAVAQHSGPFQVLTHEEREKNREAFLRRFPVNEELWVFGYGSLIWNPAFHFEEKQKAKIYGFHRKFCLHLTIGRGSPEKPGLMLALDHGGSCKGIAFKIAADKVESETEILWMREMISGAYQPQRLTIYTEKGPVCGFTFTVNQAHERYLGGLDLKATAKAISEGEGQLGSCKDYLFNTVNGLLELGVHDSYLKRLQKILKAS